MKTNGEQLVRCLDSKLSTQPKERASKDIDFQTHIGRQMRKLLPAFLFAVALCNSQPKTFIREYTYTAGEADSKISSRAIALDQVKRILLEEIGVYLQSEMTTTKEEKNLVYNELTKEQIQSITAGITETKILEEKWNGETYYIKASITVDPTEVTKDIARISADQSKLKELEEVSRKADDALAEIERLRKELATTKSDKEKVKTWEKYRRASNTLSASEWYQKGYNADKSQDYDKAIAYYQKAIDLEPDSAFGAYFNRGGAKHSLKDHQGAIADYTKAIGLRPDEPYAYYSRGLEKSDLENYQGAIADYTKAIDLKPDFADAYLERGDARYILKDYQGAITDLTKTIDLKTDYALAYYNRGLAYLEIGEKSKAIVDLMRAIELGYRVPQEVLDACK